MIRKKINFIIILAIFSFFLYSTFANGTKTFYKIGVLVKRSPEDCLEKWRHTADYFSNNIKNVSFVIIPLGYNKIYSAVENKKVDFLLVNPSVYIELEILYGVERMATLKNYRIDKGYTIYGGAVFYRSDRNDIKNYNDLKGMRFMAVNESSLGGWRAILREFKFVKIDPYHDFAKLIFVGSHDKVVYAVRDGEADAGCVSTDILEAIAKEGKLNFNNFKVIHFHKNMEKCKFIDFKFKHSTRLYPEWPFASAKHTSRDIAKKVSIALLSINPNDKAAITGNYEGWTIPLNYQEVRDCLKELRIGPYKDYGKFTLMDVIKTYLYWILGLFVLLLGLIIVIIYVIQLNKRMKAA